MTGICNGCLHTWAILRVARIAPRLETVFHVPDVLHGATMVRTETVQGAGVRFRVVRPWILVMNAVFIQTVGVIVAGLAEDGQVRDALHGVPAHVVADGGAPLKAL